MALILRYLYQIYKGKEVKLILIIFADIDLSIGRPGEQSIHKVFVDPGGSHCIATIIGSSGADTYYTHAKWKKPRILGKLKGLVVNAVAWNRQHIIEGRSVLSSFLCSSTRF